MLNTNLVNMFFDPEMDKKMVEDGYLVLPFLDKDSIVELREIYKKWHPEDPTAFYKSYFDPRMEYKLEVENKIKELFENKLSDVFRNYDAFGGLFVVKPPTQEGHLPPHQDWSFVDESVHWSINMWCPLEDVGPTNGNIMVLKGSHQYNKTIRGVGTPDVYRDHWEMIERNMESIPMKAGEAIFFFHGLLHGSTLNTTPESRISIGLTLTPKDVPLYFHYMDTDGDKKVLNRYETTPEFYIDYASKRGAKPEGVGVIDPFEFTPIDPNVLSVKIKDSVGESIENSAFTARKSSWITRLRKSIIKA
jgi:hypothetical protein